MMAVEVATIQDLVLENNMAQKKKVPTKKSKPPKPRKIDKAAPKHIKMLLSDDKGKKLGELIATAKVFTSGSVGFYANGKMINPKSGEVYQVGCSFTLVGSKPV